MVLKKYEYSHEGPSLERLERLLSSLPSRIASSGNTLITLQIDDRQKADLDETMAELGYVFVREIP